MDRLSERFTMHPTLYDNLRHFHRKNNWLLCKLRGISAENVHCFVYITTLFLCLKKRFLNNISKAEFIGQTNTWPVELSCTNQTTQFFGKITSKDIRSLRLTRSALINPGYLKYSIFFRPDSSPGLPNFPVVSSFLISVAVDTSSVRSTRSVFTHDNITRTQLSFGQAS